MNILKKVQTPIYLKNIQSFCQKGFRLAHDYALFMALKNLHNGASWLCWDEEYKFLTPASQDKAQKLCADDIGYYKFVQFIFEKQWLELKAYANESNIQIIGDIPIFVSPDSADVWAHKTLFELDSKGYPKQVAGVPPDYSSETGQLWGNPLYLWSAHKKRATHGGLHELPASLRLPTI